MRKEDFTVGAMQVAGGEEKKRGVGVLGVSCLVIGVSLIADVNFGFRRIENSWLVCGGVIGVMRMSMLAVLHTMEQNLN